MSKFKNSGKEGFLSSIPTASIELDSDLLADRCKFNFAYFEVQDAGQSFSDLTHENMAGLFNKLKDFSKESLDYWRNQRVGKSGYVLSTYGKFPSKSDFKQPKHVPHQAEWGRFRLDWASRLCGFTIPKCFDGKMHKGSGKLWCSNTFYIVFLDEEHKFYKGGDEQK
jgi:hypothetical protein